MSVHAHDQQVKADEMLPLNQLPDGTWDEHGAQIRLSQIALIDVPVKASAPTGYLLRVTMIGREDSVWFIFQQDASGDRARAFRAQLLFKLGAYLKSHP